MGKVRTDELLDARTRIESLELEKKAAAAQLFKLKQKVEAYFKEIDHLRKQLSGSVRDESPIVKQLKQENRQLRIEVSNIKLDALKLQKERDQLKSERDAALVQLKKAPIEQAAAAPPAP
jgi:predicted  nucleic acid-binding Zn-ribbon protein